MSVWVCRWVCGGVTIKDSIKADNRVEAVKAARKIAEQNQWVLKAVVSSWIELRTVRPETS